MFNVSHKFIYGTLALLYAGSCIGLDKTVVAAIVALGYALLALDESH